MSVDDDDVIIVAAGGKPGRSFIKTLLMKGLPFAILVSSEHERKEMQRLYVEPVIQVDSFEQAPEPPDFHVGHVFLFEESLPVCCKYIQVCRSWTCKPIYVITERSKPRLIYRGLGATHVIYSRGSDCSFLL
ncbi:hypothetical protein PUW24_09620 [Paenibacillus urinalis]|uniref:Uncharacterized protein n=1 Tax=Paenibacillus urinalis TaxID=521520 RepID=A0AAX3N027_9BACL|nr:MULTISPECIES: hypothetical protein [Paenibacillus]WDH83051.1 hypothetical protein PUW23_02060 [Paenibacillus urinalis]WDH99106.1 hypothetical protein PUW24_09620 [Paenibacillus urinalis]WDI02796.1 hypothetical protein PUW25_02065 [Paenibacillus urinalis]GAK40291.1 hypothetical protein TCA2_2781 [Paenibacillus sp. TCA20]